MDLSRSSSPPTSTKVMAMAAAAAGPGTRVRRPACCRRPMRCWASLRSRVRFGSRMSCSSRRGNCAWSCCASANGSGDEKGEAPRPPRHCEFRTGLRPVPLDETGHPLFHTLRPPFAGRTAALLLLFPTPGLLRNFARRNFAPRNDDPARSEALAAGANGGGIKAPSKPFSKLLQNSRVLLQAFSKQIFGGFVEFQGVTRFPNAL